jgi:hypothetical protein
MLQRIRNCRRYLRTHCLARDFLASCVLVVGFAFLISSSTAGAAEFAVNVRPVPGISTINLTGEILKGDDIKFRDTLLHARVPPLLAIVIMESKGGDLEAGLNIGREISARSYSTVVKAGEICASACALAWLAGDWRYMAPGAKIGFHAAYSEEGNILVEKGAANALVGAYLGNLKLSKEAIVYITQAPPREIRWLSVEEAMRVGINLSMAGENGD